MRKIYILIFSFIVILSGQTIAFCNETDGGRNIYQFSEAIVSGRVGRDACRSGVTASSMYLVQNCTGPTCFIDEVYCTFVGSNQTITSEIIACPQGCRAGACVQPSNSGGNITPRVNNTINVTNNSTNQSAFTSCSLSNSAFEPVDTICDGDWLTTGVGGGVDIPARFATNAGIKNYGIIPSCSYYEVCSQQLDPAIQEAVDCCRNGGTSTECRFAHDYAGGNEKSCKGLYLIMSAYIGKYNKFGHYGSVCCAARDYPEWQFWCDALVNAESTGIVPSTLYGSCVMPNVKNASKLSPANAQLNAMHCDVTPAGLVYNYPTITQNSCGSTLFPPTSVSMTQLRLRGCTTDSGVITTLLRKAGYSASEIMTVSSTYHYFNLVKLPNQPKYVKIDNYGFSLNADWCDAPWVDCHNDNGLVPCPLRSNVLGCESFAPPNAPCNGCMYNGQCYTVTSNQCVGGINYVCVGQNNIQPIGTCGSGCNGCEYQGQCYSVGASACVGGINYTCASQNNVVAGNYCNTQNTCTGCNYGGSCLSIGQTTCTNGNQMTCTSTGMQQSGTCNTGCIINGTQRQIGDQQCVNGRIQACTAVNTVTDMGPCCPGGCVVNGQCITAGQSSCSGGSNMTCIAENSLQNNGACCTGCIYNNRCYDAGQSECLGNDLYYCPAKDEVLYGGLCSTSCPGGCNFRGTCYTVGTEGCVDTGLYKCVGQNNVIRTGNC